MNSESIVDTVRGKLSRDQRPASLRKISEVARVDYDWLVKFTHGHIAEPGARKIEAVAAALRNMGQT